MNSLHSLIGSFYSKEINLLTLLREVFLSQSPERENSDKYVAAVRYIGPKGGKSMLKERLGERFLRCNISGSRATLAYFAAACDWTSGHGDSHWLNA